MLPIFIQTLPLCWRLPCSSLQPDVSASLLSIFRFPCDVDPVFDTSTVFGLLLPTVVSIGQFPSVKLLKTPGVALMLSSLAEVRPLQLLVQSKFLLHSVLDDSASPLLSTSGTWKTLRAVSYFWDHKCHFTFLFKSDYCGSNSQLTFNLFCLDVTINLNIPCIFWCLCIYFVCN